jgi:hypothetical protein
MRKRVPPKMSKNHSVTYSDSAAERSPIADLVTVEAESQGRLGRPRASGAGSHFLEESSRITELSWTYRSAGSACNASTFGHCRN